MGRWWSNAWGEEGCPTLLCWGRGGPGWPVPMGWAAGADPDTAQRNGWVGGCTKMGRGTQLLWPLGMGHMMVHLPQGVKCGCPLRVPPPNKSNSKTENGLLLLITLEGGLPFCSDFGKGGYGHTSEAPVGQRKLHSAKK